MTIMAKKVYIIHGWGGSPENDWLPWLKNKLEEKSFLVIVPAMPNTDEPKIDEWVNHLLNICPNPDENTYFVGHSIGCQAIFRYLEKPDGKKVGGIICVAGWFELANLESEEEWQVADPWLKIPIDLGKIKKVADKIIAIFSDNDPYDKLEKNKEIFSEKLGAEIIIEKNKGHFTGEDGVNELPVILKKLEEIEKENR
jgi:hypothetical protein